MKSLQIRIGHFYFDTLLLAACISLLIIGYIMVVSASLHLGVKMADDSWYYPIRQLIHIGLMFLASLSAWRSAWKLSMSLRIW